MAMLQKARDRAKEDCARAMDLAHKLSFRLRSADERMQEAEAAYYRDRTTGAEQWLMRIHNEVEQPFFHKKERDPRYGGERSALGSHISDGARRAR